MALRRFSLPFVGWLIAGFLILPTLVVVPMSISEDRFLQWPPRGFTWHWYDKLFTDPLWRDAALTSIKVAAAVTLLSTVLGTITALGLVRGRFPGKALANALVISPMIVPVVIMAIGLFYVYARLHLIGTMTGLVLAHTMLALPLVVIAVSNSLRSLEGNLERAAQNLGAGPIRTFWRITLPLILPGVVAGALFAFITSWDEIVIALFLTTPDFRTLPVVMFNQLRESIEPTVAAAATLLIAVTTVALLIALFFQRFQRKGTS